MPAFPYLAIEGAIGVGKTTLARILSEALESELLLEVFEENPFLSDFYSDRARYAFQTQIFFLLSRYRQQHSVIPATLTRSALVSDYLFAKDWLFAHLNLGGDELAMYERVHAILGEQIPKPSLVVYLKASTETLMNRIAFRDRSYERQMARQYIDDLRQSYDEFFAAYANAPVLTIDTDGVDIVRDSHNRAAVISQIKNALQGAGYQPALLDLDALMPRSDAARQGLRLTDLQEFHRAQTLDQVINADLLFDYVRLTAEVGRLGRGLSEARRHQEKLLQRLGNRQEAHDQALESAREPLQVALGETLASLLRLANAAGVDLEAAYLRETGQV